MGTNEKGSQMAASPEMQNKDTDFSVTAKVLRIFLSGQKVTAFGVNQAVGFNDARKAISTLRQSGYPIADYRLTDQRKVYYLPHDWQRIMDEAMKNKPKDLFA